MIAYSVPGLEAWTQTPVPLTSVTTCPTARSSGAATPVHSDCPVARTVTRTLSLFSAAVATTYVEAPRRSTRITPFGATLINDGSRATSVGPGTV